MQVKRLIRQNASRNNKQLKAEKQRRNVVVLGSPDEVNVSELPFMQFQFQFQLKMAS